LRDEIEPSWIGVGVDAPSAEPGGRKRALPEGAAVIVSVEGGSPADEAGLQIGDVVLGLPEQAFTRSWQFREWMMTAPRNAPNLLRVLRPGLGTEPDRELELTVFPRAEPPRKTPAGTWVVSPRAERRAP
jgi:S1-C subfamily serine protease